MLAYLEKNCKKIVKHPSDTRLESKVSSVEAIKIEFLEIVYSLEEIFDKAAGNATSYAEIQGILTAMETFEFFCNVLKYGLKFYLKPIFQ